MRFGICALFGLLVVGCSENQEVDCALSDIELAVSGNENADCNIGAKIVLDAVGGEPPYLYRFDGSPFQDLDTFEGITLGGPFVGEVQDANGCEATIEVVVTGDENSVVFTTETSTAGCGSAEGTVAVEASGGDGNYEINFDQTGFSDVNQFSGLEAGTYEVQVKDGEGCINVQGIRVLAGISYESAVKPIIIASCATTDCHVSGTGRSNLTIFSNVQNNASSIRTRVLNGSMPKEGSLTDEEIEAIVCWVDDGAPNN